MFVEREPQEIHPRSSGAKQSPDLLTLTVNIALRWSAGRNRIGLYKHLAPLEPDIPT